MAVTLSKGGNVNLAKVAPGVEKFIIGLGWDARATAGVDFDLDASAIALGADAKVTSDDDFIFYNNKEHPSKAIIHSGDNRTGAGVGDDETIAVNVGLLPSSIERVAITTTIDQYAERKQNFGMVNNAYVRVLNADTKEEIARYDLGEDYSLETAIIFGELYKVGTEWKFKAIGQGFTNGLAGLATNYGVNLA